MVRRPAVEGDPKPPRTPTMRLDEARAGGHDMPVANSTRVHDGGTIITLDNSMIGLELWPERGAKVSSITDRRTGRNWLSVTDRPWGDATALRWEDSDRAGWDECLPNIAEELIRPRT